jgi:hypothetical protein
MSTHNISRKNDIFCDLCKKRQFLVLQNSLLRDVAFSFLHNPSKLSFSHNLLCVNIADQDVLLECFTNFF